MISPKFPQHPQAALAVWLARRLRGADPDLITRVINMSDCPRSLFILASCLEAQVGCTHGFHVDTFA